MTHQAESKLDPDQFFAMIDATVKQFPNIKAVATTLREVHSTNRHDWAAVLWLDGQKYVSPTAPWTSSTASAAATASPPASSTA